jgi:addiction module HigA family antidote
MATERRILKKMANGAKILEPIHPGVLLLEEFMEPMEITPYKLAKDIGVLPPRIYEIVHGKRSISADTALRLSRYFGMSEGYWINAQGHYDLEVAKDQSRERIEMEVKPRAAGVGAQTPQMAHT